jgi:hypothetical protein
LLASLHDELRWARARHSHVLDDLNLSRIGWRDGADVGRIATADPRGLWIHRDHPVVRWALTEAENPVAVALVASALYTALNHYWTGVTNDDERAFGRALAERLAAEVVAVDGGHENPPEP